MKNIRVFEVGGHVRDAFLGIKSKDIDCAVEAPSFLAMHEFVNQNTKRIFLVKEEFLTIRAIGNDGLTKDFVLCRKDGPHSDGRRPDFVEPGTIMDDLARRDFTVNAMAIDTQTGELLDPFNGKKDLDDRILRCVGSAEERFQEDTLRIIRAIRFSITKGFSVSQEIQDILQSEEWAEKLKNISTDRIRQELDKCFKPFPAETIRFLAQIHPRFLSVIFNESKDSKLWLKITSEKK